MRYLADTHILLWLLKSPEELSVRALEILEDASAEILISVATPWEIAIKVGSGRLNAADILDNFESLMTRLNFQITEASIPQMIRSGLLPLHHRDPFDRLLAVQALDLGVPLLSRDDAFDLYGVRRIWA